VVNSTVVHESSGVTLQEMGRGNCEGEDDGRNGAGWAATGGHTAVNRVARRISATLDLRETLDGIVSITSAVLRVMSSRVVFRSQAALMARPISHSAASWAVF